VYLDVSQVEAAVYTLSPWLLEYQATGAARGRDGNRDARARVHAAFRCADEGEVGDRWVTIAAWTGAEYDALRSVTGDDVEAYTVTRRAIDVAETLQAVGIEAVPVQDFADLHTDPQIAHRGHFVPLTHPFLGAGLYERNGFRLSDAPGGYDRPGPTLGQDQDWVLGELLGLDPDEQAALTAEAALE
jgi:crotonobetainyl-CoA:carnitine CoA-transferase CaiB-like acyl-CoA transferase